MVQDHRRLVALFVLPLLVFSAGCSSDPTAPDSGYQCYTNDQCGVGKYCNNHVCTPFLCSKDHDCGKDKICEDGTCISGNRDDGGDGSTTDGGTDLEPQDGGDQAPNDGGTADDDQTDLDVPAPQIALKGDVITQVDGQGKTYKIDYGTVNVGVPVTRKISIGNTGDADLTVSVITLVDDAKTEFAIDPSVPPAFTLASGDEKTFDVTYQAKDGLTDLARARIFSNDPAEATVEVKLISEFKGDPRIVVDPVALDFGDVPLNQPKTLSATLSNQGTGNAVLQIDSVAPETGIAAVFSVAVLDPNTNQPVTTWPLYLNKGEYVTAEISYQTASRGSHQGNLIIVNSDALATLPLAARAGIPQIQVEPLEVAFGQVQTGTQGPPQAVTVRNLGVGNLSISGINFAVGSSPDITAGPPLPTLPALIAPGGELGLDIHFAPTDVNTDMATLSFESDDPDHPSIAVAIGGEGINGNAKPNAIIKANAQEVGQIAVLLNDRVELDGSASFDGEGPIAAYQWRIVKQPVSNPCGMPSTMTGETNPTTFLVLKEAGITQIGLKVEDGSGDWSDEDLLDIQVGAKPEAEIWVGANNTGFIQIDMGATLLFDGRNSPDCDGIVTAWSWAIDSYPTGRGAAPALSGGPDTASVLFDFPGNYRVSLVVLDNDNPKNGSDKASFDVQVKGPKAFRVTADWFNQGNNDDRVDVDLHLLKPGTTARCGAGGNDCYPAKPGIDPDDHGRYCDPVGNVTPDWGLYGKPVYQRDGWKDEDGAANPLNPSEEINFPSPGKGVYSILVEYRCHSSRQVGSSYLCCDDLCNFGCPACGCQYLCPCGIDGNNLCPRKAVGEVRIYVTDFYGVETELTNARRQFSFNSGDQYKSMQIGTLSWPDGQFQ